MIVSEEAIAKGIRRIVAVTGAEAQKVSRSGWFMAYFAQEELHLQMGSADGYVAAVVRSVGLPPKRPPVTPPWQKKAPSAEDCSYLGFTL